MADKQMQNITFENVRIGFKNFSGLEGPYNREGDRNFAIFLDDVELANQMDLDGWNVRHLKIREDETVAQAYIKVKVKFGERPPKIVLITSRGKNPIGEDMVNILDWADIANVDLIITPYNYNVNGSTGVSAYLKSIYVTIQEDELDLKYADLEVTGQNAIGGRQPQLAIEESFEYAEVVED